VKLAVFDIDGTLVRYSTERAFGRFLVRRGVIGPRQAWSYLSLGLRSLPTMGGQVLKKNKGYLTGLSVEEVRRLASTFVEADVADQLVAPVVARLVHHRQRGDHVVLLSGTLDAIASAIADRVGAHRAIGTRCAIRGGRFRDELPVLHPFGAEKREQTKILVAELGLSPRDVVTYANAWDDLDLLRFAGVPVAVRPDRRLRQVATDSGWEIIDDATLLRSPEQAG
jgi:HAD superfamily hydrolase (TIGR01490 family)